MKIVLGMVSLGLWLAVIPLCVGYLPAVLAGEGRRVRPVYWWLSGHVILWALFEWICVPLILTEDMGEEHFSPVVICFAAAGFLLALAGACLCLRGLRRGAWSPALIRGGFSWNRMGGSASTCFFWILAAGLILFQLVMAIVMTYWDGDDAYYIAVANLAEASGTMYKKVPYSYGMTLLDNRHGLAPFPIWIAFLARVSGMPVAAVAHTALPPVLIGMTYGIFYEIGSILFAGRRERLPIFLGFTALLVIFGDVSIYTAENFMIARSRQGKAALGSIVIPMVILLFLRILERCREERRPGAALWLLLAATVTAGCLCSTMGTFLMCLFLGILGLCGAVSYRSFGLLWRTALCCLPALFFAGLYFAIG